MNRIFSVAVALLCLGATVQAQEPATAGRCATPDSIVFRGASRTSDAALRAETGLVNERLAPYFRDIDDHARRATETIDSARDRINSLLEADLNEQSNQLNDVTRKLAAWAAIIAVPSIEPHAPASRSDCRFT